MKAFFFFFFVLEKGWGFIYKWRKLILKLLEKEKRGMGSKTQMEGQDIIWMLINALEGGMGGEREGVAMSYLSLQSQCLKTKDP